MTFRFSIACEQGGVALPKVEGEVMVTRRTGDAGEGVMLIEYGNKPARFTLDAPMTDVLTGDMLSGEIELKPYDVKVLKQA